MSAPAGHTASVALVTRGVYGLRGEIRRRIVQVRVTKTQYILEGPLPHQRRRFNRKHGYEMPRSVFRFCHERDYIEALPDTEVSRG